MEFSFIIPTIGRKDEVGALLETIYEYVSESYEVIIVDQNQNDLLDNIINNFKGKMNIYHHKVDFKGAARARNYGFKFAKGRIINFPDDDSEFSKDLIKNVVETFKENNVSAVFGQCLDKETLDSAVVKFKDEATKVEFNNIYKTTVECTMFIKHDVFEKVGKYDENLGVGTYCGAEEGADFVIRALESGNDMIYTPKIVFYHPQRGVYYNSNDIERALKYGRGFGALAYKHISTGNLKMLSLFLWFNFKSIVAMALATLKGKKGMFKYYKNTIIGRMQGFKYRRKENSKNV